MARSTIANRSARLYDKALELLADDTSLSADTIYAGVEIPVRRQLDYKLCINSGAYTTASSNTWTVALQVATAAATTATGTAVGSIVLGTAGGSRELALTGAMVEGLVSAADPLYARLSITKSGTNAGALTVGGFFTESC